MSEKLTCAKRPCGSCPYRKDVPSGLWAEHEYDKLPTYDGPTAFQHPAVFMCHTNAEEGHLCAGWVATHGTSGPNALLALRISHAMDRLDPSVLDYSTDVPVSSSGAEAAEHGRRDIEAPKTKARKKIEALQKLPRLRNQEENSG